MKAIGIRLFIATMTFTILGCGNGSGKKEVTGTVTLNGQPLNHGTIQFDGKNNIAGAEIVGGKYAITQDKGLEPGDYVVRISAPNTTAAKSEALPGIPTPPAKDRIPPQFNVASTKKVVVTADGPNSFNFSIP